jgi:hypothetical protein
MPPFISGSLGLFEIAFRLLQPILGTFRHTGIISAYMCNIKGVF